MVFKLKILQLYFKAQYWTLVIIILLSSGFVRTSEVNNTIFKTYVNSYGILFFPFYLFLWIVPMSCYFTICCMFQAVAFLKIRDCTAEEEANCLRGAGCCAGSRRPSGGSAPLLSAKEELSQERLFQTRLGEGGKERICSITKGLETVKNREQKYHGRLQSWQKKVLLTAEQAYIPFFFFF